MSRRWPRLLAAIGAHDVDVRVTTLRRAPNLRRAFGEAGVPATSLEARSVAASFAAIPRLARRLREGDVELVHSAEPVPAVVTGIAARLTRDRPTLVYSRHHTGGRRQLRVASRIAAALSDWTLVACETSRQEAIVTDHTPPARVVVAESGVVEHRTVSEHETSPRRDQWSDHAPRRRRRRTGGSGAPAPRDRRAARPLRRSPVRRRAVARGRRRVCDAESPRDVRPGDGRGHGRRPSARGQRRRRPPRRRRRRRDRRARSP
jgi:hypothetical protein